MTTPESKLPPLRFSVQGQSLTASELQRLAGPQAKTKPKRAASTEASATHKGWRVLGHAPGRLEEAQRAHRADVQRAAHPFDAAHWRMNTRKSAVNVRPYALEQAAQECAALAGRSGWLDVVVEPITRSA